MSSQTKSPVKRKQPPTGPDNVPSDQPKSPRKEMTKCKVCGKEFVLFLSHLKRSRACGAKYDVDAIEVEEQRRRIDDKAKYDKWRYEQNASEKKAASMKRYSENPEKKKVTMTAYNEKNREKINCAMKRIYYEAYPEDLHKAEFSCHLCDKDCFTKKGRDSHIDKVHLGKKESGTCQICDKKFEDTQDIKRHIREVHGGQKHICEKCPATFTRSSGLQKHIKENWHYLSYYCNQCKETKVFKSFELLKY